MCIKNNTPFKTIEQEFPSRSAALMWIIDNQLARRNINSFTRNDLIGRRYIEEKRDSVGRPANTKEWYQNDTIRTREKLAEQLNVGQATVMRAAKFSQAIDIITANTGISRASILTKKINCTQEDILELAKLDKDFQVKVMLEVTGHNYDIGSAVEMVKRFEGERKAREAREQRKQLEETLRIEREANEKLERERLRLEREEKERLEKEKFKNERAAQERLRLERSVRERVIAEEPAVDQERLRKELAERERIEREKIEAERIEREKVEKARLEKLRIEQERIDEERLLKARLEQERIDREIDTF